MKFLKSHFLFGLVCTTFLSGTNGKAQSLRLNEAKAADAVVEIYVKSLAPTFSATAGQSRRQGGQSQNSVVSASVERSLLGPLKNKEILFHSHWVAGKDIEGLKIGERYFVALQLSGKPVSKITTNGRFGDRTMNVFWRTVRENSWEPVNRDSRKRIEKLQSDPSLTKGAPEK